MSDYRKLQFWHRARALAIRIHHLVAKLPPIEQTRRGDQMIRSANSIRHNIVEGSGAGSNAQFRRFLQYSIASSDELEDQLQDLADVQLLPAADADLLGEPSQIAAMITTFSDRAL